MAFLASELSILGSLRWLGLRPDQVTAVSIEELMSIV